MKASKMLFLLTGILTLWAPCAVGQVKSCDFPEIKYGVLYNEERYRPYFPVEVGKYFYYYCNENFVTPSSTSGDYITCTDKGWKPDVPCLRKCYLHQVENGYINNSQNYYFEGKSVTVQCNPGFSVQSGQTAITCTKHGWAPAPRCIRVKSCDMPVFENARAKSHSGWFKLNDKLDYECERGYQISDGNTTGSIVCGDDGWSDTPTCYEVTCNPPYIANGAFEPQRITHRSEDEIRYTCKRGFSPTTRGSTTRCTSSGWVPVPRCSLKPCDYPEIKNGWLYDAERYGPYFPVATGKYFYYYCNSGFVTPSHHTGGYITCKREGWSPEVPCLRKCYLYEVENGHNPRSYKSYLEGQSVSIQCNPGYSLPNGHTAITCTTQDWSPSPRCIRVKTCSKADIYIENGFLSEYEYTYPVNKRTQYKCKPKYLTVDGKESGFITCLERGWSTQPICSKSCDMPVFENARAKNNGTWFKVTDRLDYECNDGYENTGGSTTGSIVCGDNGWSDTPHCFERECSIPNIPQYLEVSPKNERYKVGDVLKFTCRHKFRLIGANSIQCYHFGWSPEPPRCKGQVTSCGPPPHLPNGKVKERGEKEEYTHGDVVEYDCNPRFLMKGSKKIQCVDGSWTTLPLCVEEERTCQDIPVPEHGYHLPTEPPYHQGYSVEFNCNESFTMIGDKSITCVSGRWTQLPQCIATEQLEKCKLIRRQKFESVSSDQVYFDHNETLTFRCKGKPDKTSVCINGVWDPSLTCAEEKTQLCPPPPLIPNAQPMTTTVNYQNGEKISILCQENYLILEADEIVCKDGKWQSLPRCVEKIPCSPPSHIENGKINSTRYSEEKKEISETSYPHGTTLYYTCEEGFKLSEEDGITCHMGQWSSLPECVGLPCEPPPRIPHSVLSPEMESYHHGEEVTYICEDGFGIDGPESIKCVGGKWPSQPECKITDCLQVPTFAHAVFKSTVKESYKSGEEVEYGCEKNFQIDGSSIVKCVKSKWIGTPTCKDVSCEDPPKVENGKIISKPMIKYPPEEKVRYECNKPYKLYGEVEVMCMNGTWTEAPVCKDSKGKCDPPPPIENGDTTTFPENEYAPGSSVQYQCQALYTLQGNPQITCVNGKWTDPPRCLDACVISEEEMERHKIQLKWKDDKKIYSPTSDTVEFRCQWGYSEKTPRASFRATCREGKLTYPRCG